MGPMTGVTDGIELRQMEVTSQVHDGLQYGKGTGGVLSTGVISQTIFFSLLFAAQALGVPGQL